MKPEELAARVTVIDNFVTMMSIPLNDEQVRGWVRVLKDLPLGWLKVGADRCAAHFNLERRPRPGDIRQAAREVAGPVFVRDPGAEGPGFAGHHSSDAWPPETRAYRLLREGRAITPFPPKPTVVELPELPQQIGPRGCEPERMDMNKLMAALLKEPEIKKIKG